MLECNGSECRDGPCDGLQSSVRNHISEFCRLRGVGRSRVRATYKEGEL